VAEKAKGAPKEAAKLFEKGDVARWYEENGWKYPVQGPASSGLGAVQQFFEALGLTPPPKVDISERSVALSGNPGDLLRHALEVKAQEKRPVYAHATSNQPWLEVGRAKLNGRTATIPLIVSAVPHREGETLTAKVLVVSNGNQRFVVPVTLTVGGSLNFDAPAPVASILEYQPETVAVAPVLQPAPVATVAPVRRTSRAGIHAVPAVLLAVALLGVVVWDALAPRSTGKSAGVSLGKTGQQAGYVDLLDREPRLGIDFTPTSRRFGLVLTKDRDPLLPESKKKLTYQATGNTNNTCVRVDGYEHLFGGPSGKWEIQNKKEKERERYISSMLWPEQNVHVKQTVELLPGAQTRLLDTCLVTYDIENRSASSHKVGLRIMLDTFIGANDGVPFAIPGQRGLLTTFKEFPQKDIPDYIQALEREDLANPGTVAHLGLKVPEEGYEAVWKMLITHYPGNENIRWDVPLQPINDPPPDSCVVLYWAEQTMGPREKRKMGFTYGLGEISSMRSSNAQLSVGAGGNFRPKREFTVTAYVKNSERGQKVKLTLPKGLNLVKGQEAEQELDATAARSQVSWKVTADEAGTYDLNVTTGTQKEGYRIKIRESSIFD
jgi:hypothetical protein